MRKGSGWHNESHRHRLASMGYSTSKKLVAQGRKATQDDLMHLNIPTRQIKNMSDDDLKVIYVELDQLSYELSRKDLREKARNKSRRMFQELKKRGVDLYR